VTIEAAMTTAWLCAACATSAEQPPSYPPGPDAYCTGCRCPLDAQERIAAALAELVRRSGHRPMPEGPTCGVDEAARILQTTANGIHAPKKEVQTLEEFKKRFMEGYMTGEGRAFSDSPDDGEAARSAEGTPGPDRAARALQR